MILAHPPSQSQGVFATYHFSLLEVTYRVKQQDKLIEWDTLTAKTQSNQRRANNCKGNRERNYQSSLFKGYLLQGSFKQPKTRRRRCFPSFGNNPKRSKHFDWDASLKHVVGRCMGNLPCISNIPTTLDVDSVSVYFAFRKEGQWNIEIDEK